jgi:hypothetical protein
VSGNWFSDDMNEVYKRKHAQKKEIYSRNTFIIIIIEESLLHNDNDPT